MTPRGLSRLLASYVVVLLVSCWILRSVVSLHPVSGPIVASVYKKGERVSRKVVDREEEPTPPGGILVYERIVSDSPFIARPDPFFALSLVSGHDGVAVTLDGKTAYVTPDDLVSKQGYDHGLGVDALNMSIGADVSLIVALASGDLGARPSDVAHRATFRRIRTVRDVPAAPPRPPPVTADSLTPADVRRSLLDGAHYLARGISLDGHFRYLVDAASNKTIFGYDWPRHAGATYFMVQAASLENAPSVRSAALRALSLMKNHALVPCGEHQCIGDPGGLELGSIALATIAFAEAVRTGLDKSDFAIVQALAETIMSAQRGDGEFMHVINNDGTPVDVQLLYFSGEATLALARAHEVTGDSRFLEAARNGLAHLVGGGWSFFGDRYYFGEEHWTCQAMGDLWDRAPSPAALDFCERWQAYGRKLQMHEGEAVFDCDGAIGVGPVVTPRLTPVASRGEAGVATLDVLQKIHASPERIEPLREQLRRSLALLVRGQLRGQVDHLLADPHAVYGAMPGSEVDWQLRIDYAQHAGSAMVRWLDVTSK